MKKILTVLLLVLTITAQSQDKKKHDFSKEIDVQLWEKFVEAYNARDAKKYNAIHTDDIVRITKNGIRQGKVFKEGIINSYGRKNQPKREIEFKHEHRIHEKEIAYEVGYFKLTYFNKELGNKTYYGRFSVVLKKEKGRWKIAQDWDVDQINGVPITAKDYEKLESKIIAKKE
ncbi:nuclear transport factor 2 family protein [Pseudotenacibaculum sp. MALMAid0570]|uniref:YybH family protein n=1 Tax=Pseudotenacibaculum sp. MALMAid0570 TaxID=3143938 RepID=UPI0032DE7F1E